MEGRVKIWLALAVCGWLLVAGEGLARVGGALTTLFFLAVVAWTVHERSRS